MRLNVRQWAVLGLLILCACITVVVALFGPLRYALIGLTVTVVVSAALMLLFLRKVLAAVYSLDARVAHEANVAKENRTKMEALESEFAKVGESIDTMQQHIPERVAVRLAYEIELGRRTAPNHEQV